MRRIMAAVAVAGVLAVGGCGADGGKVTEGTPRTDATTSSSSTTAEFPADAVTEAEETDAESKPASMRQGVKYEDGVEIQITRIKQGKVGQYTSGGKRGGPMTTFTVRIKNGSSTTYDAVLVSVQATYGTEGDEAEAVYDQGVEGISGKVLPGKSRSGTYAFAIPTKELGDVTVEVSLAVTACTSRRCRARRATGDPSATRWPPRSVPGSGGPEGVAPKRAGGRVSASGPPQGSMFTLTTATGAAMSSTFNVRAEVRTRTDHGDLVDALDGFHPAVSPLGGPDRIEVVITLPAEGIRQAAAAGLSVIEQAAGPVRSCEVMTTDDFDRRLGLPPVSDLMSVPEVAEELGITRQAVLARLSAGTLAGTQVGRAWVIPRSALSSTSA